MNAIANVKYLAGDKREQVKSLLKEGIPSSQVALAVCVDPSYISQLMAEEEFSKEVIEARVTSLASFTARDNKYDKIEDRLLGKLEDQLEMMVNPDRILRAIVVVNNAKRRGIANDQPMQQATQIINLTLPTVIVNKYQTNQNNEVIDVNGEALVGMPATRLLEQVARVTDTKLKLDDTSKEQVKEIRDERSIGNSEVKSISTVGKITTGIANDGKASRDRLLQRATITTDSF